MVLGRVGRAGSAQGQDALATREKQIGHICNHTQEAESREQADAINPQIPPAVTCSFQQGSTPWSFHILPKQCHLFGDQVFNYLSPWGAFLIWTPTPQLFIIFSSHFCAIMVSLGIESREWKIQLLNRTIKKYNELLKSKEFFCFCSCRLPSLCLKSS